MKIHKFKQRLVRSLILVAAVVGTITLFTNLSFAGGQTVASADDNINVVYDPATKTLTVGAGEFQIDYEDPFMDTVEKIVIVQAADSVNKAIAPVDSSGLFSGMGNLKQIIGLRNLDTSNATTMYYMFRFDYSLTSLDLSGFDTSKVTNMQYFADSCNELKTIDLSSFNTSQVTEMRYMFRFCENLTELNLSSFTSTPTLNTGNMFNGTTALWKLTLGQAFVIGSSTNLPDPVIETKFNQVLEVNSTKWLHKTGGTDFNPTGDSEVTSAEIATAHTLGNTDTYVWQGDLGNTTVEYVVQPTYTITIPATITIPSATVAGTGNVALSAYPKVPYEERFIHISATSGTPNPWHLTTTGDATGAEYNFTAEGGVNLKTGSALVIEADGEAPATVKTISASLTDNTHKFKYAGTYMDTVTFTIQTADSE